MAEEDDLKVTLDRDGQPALPVDAAVLLAKHAAARQSSISADLRSKPTHSEKGGDVAAREADRLDQRKERAEKARKKAVAAKEAAAAENEKPQGQDAPAVNTDTGRVDIKA